MTQVLPEAEAGRVPRDGAAAIATAGLACGVLFFAVVILAMLAHPRIEALVLTLIVAAPVVAIFLGSVARRRAKRAGRKEPGRARVAVWLGGVELALVLAFGVMIPSMCRATEPANRAKCANNLRQIGLALLMYANSHDGHFPDTLNALLLPDSGAEITADVFTCPSSTDERALGQTPEELARNLTAAPGHLSYVYVGAGLTSAAASAERVLAYENPHNHNNEGIHFLYGDAHTEFLDRKQAEQLIAKLRTAAPLPATRPAGANP